MRALLAAAVVITGVGPREADLAWDDAATPIALVPQPFAPPLVTDATARVHHLHLSGLSPATSYAATLGTTQARFTTAPAAPVRQVKFLVYGDNRTNTDDHAAVVRAILSQESDLDFALHTGDLAQNYPFSQQWAHFFEVEHDLLARLPIFVAIGNHETMDLLNEYARWFAPPTWDPDRLARFHAFDWGQVHIVLLDSFDTARRSGNLHLGLRPGVSDAQLEWLRADLTAAQARGQVIFAAVHQGPFSHPAPDTGHGGSPDVEHKVVPLLVEHGAVAIFAGHDHFYERGRLGDLDYFVAGGGGAPLYDVQAHAPGVIVARKTLSYVVIEVDDQAVKGYARDAQNAVFDTFVLPTLNGAQR